MSTYDDIAKHFALRKAGSRGGRSSKVFTSYSNDRIYSYGSHFTMAYANDKDKIIVVNGDRYSHTTDRHQSIVRSQLRSYLPANYRQIIIPFTVINRAGITIESIMPMAVESDFEQTYCETHGYLYAEPHRSAFQVLNEHKWASYDADTNEYTCKTHYEHRLGGSVFRAKKFGSKYAYFLSGFDETHNSNSDGYFICELPRPIKTVADAYESLKPKVVRDAIAAGLDVKRQGDIFAIPVEGINTRSLIRRHIERDTKSVSGGRSNGWQRIEKVVMDYPTFFESHCASEVGAAKNGVSYIRGQMIHAPHMRNPEHKRINLGKIWHRWFKNTAKASWASTTGRVD